MFAAFNLVLMWLLYFFIENQTEFLISLSVFCIQIKTVPLNSSLFLHNPTQNPGAKSLICSS